MVHAASQAAQVHMATVRYVYQRRPGSQATPCRPMSPLFAYQNQTNGSVNLGTLLPGLYDQACVGRGSEPP
jgi:hypothetical protein